MAEPGQVVAWVLFGLVIIITILGFTGVITPKNLEGGTCKFQQPICNMFKAIGTPDWFLSSEHFYWYFLAPIAVIGLVVYGFLDILRLFRRNVNIPLAIAIALVCIPTQVFTTFVATLMAVLGGYAVVAFFIVFVAGVWYIAGGTIRRAKSEFGPPQHALDVQIQFLKQRLRELPENAASAPERRELTERILRLESEKHGIKTMEQAAKQAGEPTKA